MVYFLQDEGCLLGCQGLKDGFCIFKVKKGLVHRRMGFHVLKDNCLYGIEDREGKLS